MRNGREGDRNSQKGTDSLYWGKKKRQSSIEQVVLCWKTESYAFELGGKTKGLPLPVSWTFPSCCRLRGNCFILSTALDGKFTVSKGFSVNLLTGSSASALSPCCCGSLLLWVPPAVSQHNACAGLFPTLSGGGRVLLTLRKHLSIPWRFDVSFNWTLFFRYCVLGLPWRSLASHFASQSFIHKVYLMTDHSFYL